MTLTGDRAAVDTPALVDTPPTPVAANRPQRSRVGRWWRKRPIKRSTIWVHRWLSLVLGWVLLVETTTGAILLYDPELQRDVHAKAYADGVSASTPMAITFDDASKAVQAENPKFKPGYLYRDNGTVLVSDVNTGDVVTVDPRNGEIVGGWKAEEKDLGVLAWTLKASENIHLCALTCEGDPLYVAWLTKEIPHSQFLGFTYDGESHKLSWGGLILGGLAVLLLFLSLSGIWLWWPTFRHFKRGVRVRLKAKRYARDYDLHQVVGMIAVPLLLIWGLTGMSYEFGFTEKAWYAALPGERGDDVTLVSHTKKGPEVGYEAAVGAAQKAVGTTDPPVYYEVPAADDKTAPYSVWFSDGYDPWAGAGGSGGDLQVLVDRHDASRTAVAYGNANESTAQHLYQDFNYPIHSGVAVNGWWRIIWLVLALTPLLLAWTGVSTWLFKRTVRKRRKRAQALRDAKTAAA